MAENEVLEPQQTLHNSPSRASYGVSIVRILEKIHRAITPPHCVMYFLPWLTAEGQDSDSDHAGVGRRWCRG